MLFSEIIGHTAIKTNLLNLCHSERIAHAYLFTGEAGSGVLPLAIAFAQTLCCEHPTDTGACGDCRSCQQFSRLSYPDLHFTFPYIKKDSNDTRTCVDYVEQFRGLVLSRKYFTLDDWHNTLGVETKQSVIYEVESDAIIESSSIKPYYDKYKVYLIWLPERMNLACANKLLKILEEPFPKTLFLLVSERPEMLLPTILSRVQEIHVPPIDERDLATALQVNNSLSLERAQEIAHLSDGDYLKTLALLDTSATDTTFFEWFKTLMRNAWLVGIKQDYKALVAMRKWSIDVADSKSGRDKLIDFLRYCQRSIREYYVYNYGTPTLNYLVDDEYDFAKNFAPFITVKNMEGFMNLFAKAEDIIRQNGNAKIVFFDLGLNAIVLIKHQ